MMTDRPPATSSLRVPVFRLLVVTNETAEGNILHHAIVRLARGRQASVMLLAPALNSRIRYWCSDEDSAREAARRRLDRALGRLREAGVEATGMVGDANPLRAIEDALRLYPAEELLISTHPESRSNWLARDLPHRAFAQFGLPTEHIVVDLACERSASQNGKLAAA